ncbi:gasdermin-D-like isoform X1 [Microtus oregoni]|uniref:gasdermin-D-like isoform X1 n=1 Tax=Microtus oregoni TaxID=111838 RepID=UPI001BB1F639|nr:gasdermin-D-like isoform X1 [Microtus oregoni]
MPSVFVEVVRSVLKEVYHRGELIPVDSLGNSTSFRPYCLLTKKLSSSWFWKSRYRCVNLSIKDILEPNAPEPEPECCDHFRITVVVDGNIQGRMALAGKGYGELSGAAAVSNSCNVSMNVQIRRVAQNTWEVLQNERCLRQPEHRILQQLRSRGDDVFVVTEVLQTKEEVQVTQTNSRKGIGQFAVPGAFLKGEGRGQLSQRKMVTIPAGSVLAFRVTKLLIDPTWDILLFPDEKKRTFELPPSKYDQRQHSFSLLAILQPKLLELRAQEGQYPLVDPKASQVANLISGTDPPTQWPARQYKIRRAQRSIPPDRIHGEQVARKDFQGLRAEVKAGCTQLGYLEMELRQQLLMDIGRILHDQPSMEALEASLEQALCSGGQVEPLDGPAGSILECLKLSSEKLVLEFTAAIFYLLGALTVLSETQQQLLANALETTVLSKQLELVEHILEWSSPWQKQNSVALPPRLLGNSWHEEAPIWILLEECGLTLQVDTPQVHWEPTSQGPTCALYASLALLSSLSLGP